MLVNIATGRNQDTEFGKKELSRNDFLNNFEISSSGYDHKIGILS